MTADVRTAGPEMTAADAAGLMASYDVGSIPVVDGDELLGIITDRDLIVRVVATRDDPAQVHLSDILTKHSLATVTPDTRVSEARDLMASRRVRRLPVVKDHRLVGIVSLGDLAVERDPGSVLADVSRAPGNR
jgi:CBS domain-containing protein